MIINPNSLLKNIKKQQSCLPVSMTQSHPFLFFDTIPYIVGFTQMCSDLEPAALLLILDGIFTQWDALVEKYKLQKIKTIGDCFMAAGGVPERTVDHAERY